MRDEWHGPEGVEIVVEPTAARTAENASRTLPLLAERGIRRALVVCTAFHRHRVQYFFTRLYSAAGIETELHSRARRPHRAGARLGARRASRVPAPAPGGAGGALRKGLRMSDTLVFIPAWNEEENLPAVLDAVHRELPEVDLLVVDDGSTDGTAAVAREHGATVHSFGENRGLPQGNRGRLPLGARPRLRVLRPRRRGRAAPARGARAAARARAQRRL
jgi:hypothetical protein